MPIIANDYRIDSLLAGANLRWGEPKTTPNVTYSFMTALPTYSTSPDDAKNFSVFTDEQKVAGRAIFKMLSDNFNVNFTEVADTGSSYGQINLGNSDQGSVSVGYARYPTEYTSTTLSPNDGDVYINNLPSAGQLTGVVPGSNAWSTLIHEIGHAIGLKHPGSYNAGEPARPPAADEVVLPKAEDSESYTLMSYTTHPQKIERVDLAIYDRLTLTYLYGAKPQNTGDDTYKLTDADGRWQKMWVDNSGTDTIDASAVTTAVTIDLTPSSFSSIGTLTDGTTATNKNFSMYVDTMIENVIGGVGNDTFTGNSVNNLINGGDGIDTVTYKGNLANFSLKKGASSITLQDKAGTAGTDTLTNIEKLKFDDTTINLAVQTQATTIPAATLKTLEELYSGFFKRIPDADGLSYWIDQFKGGKTLNQIADSFYDAGVQYSAQTGFSSTMTNDDFIKIVYANVLGRSGATAPGATDIAFWSNNITNGAATRGSMVNEMITSAHSYANDPTWNWVDKLLKL
jgi:serralysin